MPVLTLQIIAGVMIAEPLYCTEYFLVKISYRIGYS